MTTDHAVKLPVFHGHGTADPVVKFVTLYIPCLFCVTIRAHVLVKSRFDWGKQSVEKLREFGFKDVEFKAYPNMPHSFCAQEQNDLESFLRKVLPEQ